MKARWIFLAIFCTVVVMVFLIGFDFVEDSVEEKKEIKEVPDAHFEKFHTDNFRFEHKDWDLHADSGVVYEKQGKVNLQNVLLQFFTKEKGTVSSKILADNVALYKKENRLVFTGNVRISSKDGSVLTGQEFVWDDEQQQISTQGFARIDRPNGDVIQGIGLIANKNLDDIVFDRNVSGKKVNIQDK